MPPRLGVAADGGALMIRPTGLLDEWIWRKVTVCFWTGDEKAFAVTADLAGFDDLGLILDDDGTQKIYPWHRVASIAKVEEERW